MTAPYVIELPATMKPLLEAEARDHGFTSVADYLAALVRANARVELGDPSLEAGLPGGRRLSELPELVADLPHLGLADADQFAADLDSARRELTEAGRRDPRKS